MGFSNENLRRALDRPPPPAPIYGPHAGYRPAQPTVLRPYPPMPWYHRIDPMLLLGVLLIVGVIGYILGRWLVSVIL